MSKKIKINWCELDSIDLDIIQFVEKYKEPRTVDIRGYIGFSLRGIRMRLKKLVEQGILKEKGNSPTDPKRYYVIS